jgi:hypothetical protein
MRNIGLKYYRGDFSRNTFSLSTAMPSPEGEGWVSGIKIWRQAYFYPLILAFSLREKGYK